MNVLTLSLCQNKLLLVFSQSLGVIRGALGNIFLCPCFLALVMTSDEKRVPFQMSEHKQEPTQKFLDRARQSLHLPFLISRAPVCQWSSSKADARTSLNRGVWGFGGGRWCKTLLSNLCIQVLFVCLFFKKHILGFEASIYLSSSPTSAIFYLCDCGQHATSLKLICLMVLEEFWKGRGAGHEKRWLDFGGYPSTCPSPGSQVLGMGCLIHPKAAGACSVGQ